jgi:hypothetical protein
MQKPLLQHKQQGHHHHSHVMVPTAPFALPQKSCQFKDFASYFILATGSSVHSFL